MNKIGLPFSQGLSAACACKNNARFVVDTGSYKFARRGDLARVASLLHSADRLGLRHLHQRCKAFVGFRLAQLTATCNADAINQAVRVIADAGVNVACALESCVSVMWCLSTDRAQDMSCPVCQAYQGWCRRCGNCCFNVLSNGRIPSVEKVQMVLKKLDSEAE